MTVWRVWWTRLGSGRGRWRDVVGTRHATQAERERALQQARLPVKMGGLGLTSQVLVAPAARVGTWALVWGAMQRLLPRVFGEVDLSTAHCVPSFEELRDVHRDPTAQYRSLEVAYKAYAAVYYDYDKEGEGHVHFHPQHLPARDQLAPLTDFGARALPRPNTRRSINTVSTHH